MSSLKKKYEYCRCKPPMHWAVSGGCGVTAEWLGPSFLRGIWKIHEGMRKQRYKPSFSLPNHPKQNSPSFNSQAGMHKFSRLDLPANKRNEWAHNNNIPWQTNLLEFKESIWNYTNSHRGIFLLILLDLGSTNIIRQKEHSGQQELPSSQNLLIHIQSGQGTLEDTDLCIWRSLFSSKTARE